MKKLLTILLILVLSGIHNLYAEMEAYSFDDSFLGYVVDKDTVLTSNGKIITLDRFGNVANEYLEYTTTDCTGIPYVFISHKNYIFKNGPGYYETTGATMSQDIASRWDNDQCLEISFPGFPVTAIQLIPAETIPFTLPVNMPVNYKINPKVVVVPLN